MSRTNNIIRTLVSPVVHGIRDYILRNVFSRTFFISLTFLGLTLVIVKSRVLAFTFIHYPLIVNDILTTASSGLSLLIPILLALFLAFGKQNIVRSHKFHGYKFLLLTSIAATSTTTYLLASESNLINPVIKLTADPGEIDYGDCSLLSWRVRYDLNADIFLNGQPVGLAGDEYVCPSQERTYTLQVRLADGTTREDAVIVQRKLSVAYQTLESQEQEAAAAETQLANIEALGTTRVALTQQAVNAWLTNTSQVLDAQIESTRRLVELEAELTGTSASALETVTAALYEAGQTATAQVIAGQATAAQEMQHAQATVAEEARAAAAQQNTQQAAVNAAIAQAAETQAAAAETFAAQAAQAQAEWTRIAGGIQQPTPVIVTATPAPTATPTATPSPTPSPTSTVTPSPTPSVTPTPEDTETPITPSPTPTPSSTPTLTPSPTGTATATPSVTPTEATATPTLAPVCPFYAQYIVYAYGVDDFEYSLCEPDGKTADVGVKKSSLLILDMGADYQIVDGPGIDFYYHEWLNTDSNPVTVYMDWVEVAVAPEPVEGVDGPFDADYVTVLIWGDDDPTNNGTLAGYENEAANQFIHPDDLIHESGIGIDIGADDGTLYRYIRIQSHPPAIKPGQGDRAQLDAIEAVNVGRPEASPPPNTGDPFKALTGTEQEFIVIPRPELAGITNEADSGLKPTASPLHDIAWIEANLDSLLMISVIAVNFALSIFFLIDVWRHFRPRHEQQ